MKDLISQAELARRRGVSKQAVSKLLRPGGKLHEALIGRKIDASHRSVQVYLSAQEVNPTSPEVDVFRHPERVGLPDDGTPDAMIAIQKLTLGELTERMGGNAELSDWLKTLKTSEEVRTARLRNDELQGLIIRRDLVAKHVFGAMDEACRRLLSDAARTITRQLHANAESGVSLEKSEGEVRGIISKVLEPVFRKHEKILRNPQPPQSA